MKWLQRYKEKEIKDGDINTRYYYARVNGRRRKNRIISLEQEEGTIEGEDQLMKYITDFYKNLFGQPDCSQISLQQQDISQIPAYVAEELINPSLCKKFMIWCFKWRKTKAWGLMGSLLIFIRNFGS